MKRQNENMKLKRTARKDFVFADPLLPFGTIREANAHCTHLQVTQATTQTKTRKRVQFLPANLTTNRMILITFDTD